MQDEEAFRLAVTKKAVDSVKHSVESAAEQVARLSTPTPLPSVRRNEYLIQRAKKAKQLNTQLRDRLAAVVGKITALEDQVREKHGEEAVEQFGAFEESERTRVQAALLAHLVTASSAPKKRNQQPPKPISKSEARHVDPQVAPKTETAVQTNRSDIAKLRAVEDSRSIIYDRRVFSAASSMQTLTEAKKAAADGEDYRKPKTIQGKTRRYPALEESEASIKATIPTACQMVLEDEIIPARIKVLDDKVVITETKKRKKLKAIAPALNIPLNSVIDISLGQAGKAFSLLLGALRSGLVPTDLCTNASTAPQPSAGDPAPSALASYDFSTAQKLSSAFYRSLNISYLLPNLQDAMNRSEAVTNLVLSGQSLQDLSPQAQMAISAHCDTISIVLPSFELHDIIVTALDLSTRHVTPAFPSPADFSQAAAMSTPLSIMTAEERSICEAHHIPPHVYVQAKKHLLNPEDSEDLTTLKDLKQYVDIDRIRLKRILEFFETKGWIRRHLVYYVEDAPTVTSVTKGF